MTTIEWTHRPGTTGETWNPVRGCELVSQGCKNCYAMIFAHRFSGPGKPYEGLTKNTNSGVKWTGEIHLAEDMLHNPLKWREPRTVFVNSMSDLFHKDVPFDFIDKVFDVMDAAIQHTFLILTKRADRMKEYFIWKQNGYGFKFEQWPLPNVRLGVSCEDQQTANERIPLLLSVPAVVRFLSCEPLLGAIDLKFESNCMDYGCADFGPCKHCIKYDVIHWVIAGGESGHDARPMHPDWVRSLRDQCKAAGVPFFFKQWGEWAPSAKAIELLRPCDSMGIFKCKYVYKDGSGIYDRENVDWIDIDSYRCEDMYKLGKSKSGNLLDGKQHLEFPVTNKPALV